MFLVRRLRVGLTGVWTQALVVRVGGVGVAVVAVVDVCGTAGSRDRADLGGVEVQVWEGRLDGVVSVSGGVSNSIGDILHGVRKLNPDFLDVTHLGSKVLVVGVHETKDLEFRCAEVLVGGVSARAPAGLGTGCGIEPSHDVVNLLAVSACSDPVVSSEEVDVVPGAEIEWRNDVDSLFGVFDVHQLVVLAVDGISC